MSESRGSALTAEHVEAYRWAVILSSLPGHKEQTAGEYSIDVEGADKDVPVANLFTHKFDLGNVELEFECGAVNERYQSLAKRSKLHHEPHLGGIHLGVYKSGEEDDSHVAEIYIDFAIDGSIEPSIGTWKTVDEGFNQECLDMFERFGVKVTIGDDGKAKVADELNSSEALQLKSGLIELRTMI